MESHIFLSHRSSDKPLVERLAHGLLDAGLSPWLDKWELVPGRPWQDALERAIQEATTIVVCIGPSGLGDVQIPEMRASLDLAWRDRERLVVPFLLPGADVSVVPDFLRERTWIDVRQADGWDAGLRSLVAAVEGRSPGPMARSQHHPPYRGLAAFGIQDAPHFFGRRAALDELLGHLRKNRRLVTILGASGAGKSSLLLAGLIPALQGGELDGRYDWRIASLRPGPRPLHTLAVELCKLRGEFRADDLREQELRLRAHPSTLSDEVDLLVGEESPRCLLAIDQFEEVFTVVQEAEDRRLFLANVLHAVSALGGRVTVVCSLRADFLAEALGESRELAAAVKESGSVLLPMSAAELQETILRPALREGLTFESGLVDTLVREVEGQPGDLPLLQFTLESLWRERSGDRLTWDTYRRLGGIQGSITRRADAFLEGRGEEERETIRRIFVRLVHLGQESGPGKEALVTRRQTTPSELDASVPGSTRPLVEALIQERLLTAREDSVEVAHEALISHWETLGAWIRRDQSALRIQEEVAEAAARWLHRGEDTDLLWRGHLLARARELLNLEAVHLTPEERRFLESSADVERRGMRRRTFGIAVALSLLSAVALLGVVAMFQSRRAETRLQQAVEVADLIVFKVDRDLAPIAGTAEIRRELLDAGAKLLEQLRAGRDEAALRSRMAHHFQVGDLEISHGNLEAAKVEYEEAVLLARELLYQDPDSPGPRASLSVSYNKLGEVAMKIGDLSLARESFQHGLEIRVAMAEADPENAILQHDLSFSYNKLGDVAQRTGDLSSAQESFQKGLEIARALVEADPMKVEFQLGLSVSYNNLGDVAASKENLPLARDSFQHGLEIARALVEANPMNANFQRNLSGSYGRLGKVAMGAGDLSSAQESFQKGLKIDRELAEADPMNADFQRNLSISYVRLGDVAMRTGELSSAQESFQQSLRITQDLAEADLMNAALQRDLSSTFERLGDVAMSAGELFLARESYDESLEIREALVEADPTNADIQRDLSVSYDKLGSLALAANDLEGARKEFTEGLKITEFLVARNRRNPGLLKDALISRWMLSLIAFAMEDRVSLDIHRNAGLQILQVFERDDLFEEDVQVQGLREEFEALAGMEDLEPQ